jgi:hypothetical protein
MTTPGRDPASTSISDAKAELMAWALAHDARTSQFVTQSVQLAAIGAGAVMTALALHRIFPAKHRPVALKQHRAVPAVVANSAESRGHPMRWVVAVRIGQWLLPHVLRGIGSYFARQPRRLT